MEKIPVVAVAGPTATGKTRLAVALAKRFDGEVVSADSMQIYRGMDIGTAKPSAEEMRGIPHHLIDIREPGESFSVAEFVELAGTCIRGIRSRGHLPIVAGGTGLYIRSLLHHVRFAPEGRDEALRASLFQKAREQGPQALVKELGSFDPESARRIHPNNVPRLVRAIEIFRVTGETMTKQAERSHSEPSPYDACLIGLDYRDRQKLYEAIDRRVEQMINNGLAREAEHILREGSGTALQAIGYKELSPYFKGECTLKEAAEQIQTESRRYAKRQLTWFRRDPEIDWLHVDDYPDFDTVIKHAEQLVLKKGWPL